MSWLRQQSPMDLPTRRQRARPSAGSPVSDPPANGPCAAAWGVRPCSRRRPHAWSHQRGLSTRRTEVPSAARATRVLPQLGRRKPNHLPAGLAATPRRDRPRCRLSMTNLASPGPPQPCRNRPTVQRPPQRRQQARERDRLSSKHPLFPYLDDVIGERAHRGAEDTVARRAGQQCVQAGAFSGPLLIAPKS